MNRRTTAPTAVRVPPPRAEVARQLPARTPRHPERPGRDRGRVSDPTLEVIADTAALEALEPEWSALAAAAAARPFTRPYWCVAWWQHLGRGDLAVVTARVDGELVGLAPLHLRRRGPVRSVRFLGHGVGTVGETLLAPGHAGVAAHLWRRVLEIPGSYLELVNFARPGGGLDALTGLDGATITVAPRDVCPFIPVSGSFDTYWAGRGSELHRLLRRSTRALDRRNGTWRAELITDAARAEEVLPAVTRTFDAAERNNPRQHLLGPQSGPFTKAMLSAAARADALRLFVGWVDDRVASFIVALRDEHQLALWLNRFDPEFADIGPGHLMLKSMVEYGFDHHVQRIDFLLGDFRYKRSWCTDSIETVTVTGARRRSTLLAGEATRSLLRRARSYTGRPS